MDKNFDANTAEVFISLRYEFSEPLSLDRKEQAISMVEEILEPHREEMHARHIYSFWSDRWSMTRIYMEEGHSNDRAMALARAKLREILPDLPGVNLMVEDQSGGRHRRGGGGKSVAFQLVGEDSGVLVRTGRGGQASGYGRSPGWWTPGPAASREGWSSSSTWTASWPRCYGVPLNQPAEVISLTYRGRRLPALPHRGR